jgi:hypothetical protein
MKQYRVFALAILFVFGSHKTTAKSASFRDSLVAKHRAYFSIGTTGAGMIDLSDFSLQGYKTGFNLGAEYMPVSKVGISLMYFSTSEFVNSTATAPKQYGNVTGVSDYVLGLNYYPRFGNLYFHIGPALGYQFKVSNFPNDSTGKYEMHRRQTYGGWLGFGLSWAPEKLARRNNNHMVFEWTAGMPVTPHLNVYNAIMVKFRLN